MKNLILIITIILSSNQLNAQNIINRESTKNRAYIRAGIDPNFNVAIGYQRNLKIGDYKNQLTTFAEWNFAPSRFSLKNSEFKIGGIYPVFEKNAFKIVNKLNLSIGSTSNVSYSSLKLAAADEIAIGYYKKKWFVALTGEYEKVFLTKITHTDEYRERYYKEAIDGWYTGTGGTIQLGIELGYTFKEKLDVHLEVKRPFTEKFNGLAGSPLHVNLGLAYRF